jgi:hypothetical protein
MPETDDVAVVYVSPDGEHEMPLTSPAAQLNWAARGWKRKDGKPTMATAAEPRNTPRPRTAPAADK